MNQAPWSTLNILRIWRLLAISIDLGCTDMLTHGTNSRVLSPKLRHFPIFAKSDLVGHHLRFADPFTR